MKPSLAFVSPVFLFPNNTGGRIRTTNILRGLKGGHFDITLLGPGGPAEQQTWKSQLDSVCDRFIAWPAQPARPRWMRAGDLFSDLPVNVAADRRVEAIKAVGRTLQELRFDVVVFDFVHAAVLKPASLLAPSICFTHNVEAQIFARHADRSTGPMRWLWRSQHAKMRRFEGSALRRFSSVVAVSERDAAHFRAEYGVQLVRTIPTGVDLDYFEWRAPPETGPTQPPTVVFIGSMDWDPNIDGVRYFIDRIWPAVLAEVPQARFVVVGRDPPAALLARARSTKSVSFTGFVDDVRPYVRAAQVAVIPLRIGGGTRIKAFEAMAMGCPVMSSAIGIEGLDVTDGQHFLLRDSDSEQARAVVELLRNSQLRLDLSTRARQCVEERFGFRVAASAFEDACREAMNAVGQ